MTGSSGAPIDGAVLETFRERLRTHSLVARVETEHIGGTPSVVVCHFDAGRYPETVTAARVEMQWCVDDDYNFHYIEVHSDGSVWQCRWDRHPNPHAADAHFHRPPDADATDVVDDPIDDVHPTDLLTRTLMNVRDRIDQLWEET